jgi:hypothetical protein
MDGFSFSKDTLEELESTVKDFGNDNNNATGLCVIA